MGTYLVRSASGAAHRLQVSGDGRAVDFKPKSLEYRLTELGGSPDPILGQKFPKISFDLGGDFWGCPRGFAIGQTLEASFKPAP